MFSTCSLLPVLVEAIFNVLDAPWDKSNWFESCHHHNLWSLASNLSNPSYLNALSVLPLLSAPIGVWVIITCNARSPDTQLLLLVTHVHPTLSPLFIRTESIAARSHWVHCSLALSPLLIRAESTALSRRPPLPLPRPKHPIRSKPTQTNPTQPKSIQYSPKQPKTTRNDPTRSKPAQTNPNH